MEYKHRFVVIILIINDNLTHFWKWDLHYSTIHTKMSKYKAFLKLYQSIQLHQNPISENDSPTSKVRQSRYKIVTPTMPWSTCLRVFSPSILVFHNVRGLWSSAADDIMRPSISYQFPNEINTVWIFHYFHFVHCVGDQCFGKCNITILWVMTTCGWLFMIIMSMARIAIYMQKHVVMCGCNEHYYKLYGTKIMKPDNGLSFGWKWHIVVDAVQLILPMAMCLLLGPISK